MLYVCNAFSLSMVPADCTILVRNISLDSAIQHAVTEAVEGKLVSAVGHPDTARLFSELLTCPEIRANRMNLQLSSADLLLVGQYTGPRLPEGVTQLPEGARIEWRLVEIVELDSTAG